MRALKFIVITLGLAILVATAFLVAVIVDRAGKVVGRANRDAPIASDAPIAVPPGFRVAATEISGDRVLVRLEGREPGAAADEIRLLVIDADGRQRTLRLTLPASAPAGSPAPAGLPAPEPASPEAAR